MIINKKGKIATLADLISDEIRNAIINEEYKKGDRLIINEIAEKHNVSIIPVREALKLLSEEGYIQIEPYKGAIVTTVPYEKIFMMRHIIWEINKFAIRVAWDKIDEETYNTLKNEIQILEKSPGLSYWTNFNINFWGKLISYIEIPAISNLLSVYYSYAGNIYQYILRKSSNEEFKTSQLYEILDAMHNKEQEKAVELFQNRITILEEMHKRVAGKLQKDMDADKNQ